MTDAFIRHLVSFLSTLVVLFGYYAGYYSGKNGWWWTVFSVGIIYLAMYKFVNAGGHH